jgi:5-methylcytosine-specific restriction endonuclease McrA
MKRDKRQCGICGEKVERHEASRDHIISLSVGGSNTEDNIQLTHQLCNGLKQQFLEEIGLMP